MSPLESSKLKKKKSGLQQGVLHRLHRSLNWKSVDVGSIVGHEFGRTQIDLCVFKGWESNRDGAMTVAWG